MLTVQSCSIDIVQLNEGLWLDSILNRSIFLRARLCSNVFFFCRVLYTDGTSVYTSTWQSLRIHVYIFK